MDAMRAYCIALEWLWGALGFVCLSGSLLFALKPLYLEGLDARLERIQEAYPWVPRLIWGLGVPAIVTVFKVVQYRSFELLFDTGIKANLLWNLAHGYGFYSSVLCGQSFLAVHFSLTLAVLAPLVRLWNSTLVVVLAHGLAVGSSIWAAYLLGLRVGRRALWGWLTALLALGHPFFHDLVGSPVNTAVFVVPIFLWTACCWEYGLRKSAVVLAAVLLTTREQIPFLFFGLGLWAWLRGSGSAARKAAIALCLGSPLIWFAELALMRHMQGGLPRAWDTWGWFSEGPGGSPEAVLDTVLHRPWMFFVALVWPPVKLWRVFKVFASFAFVPLFAGAALIPALTSWLPQQLANSGTVYHQLNGSECAYVAGPLVWAFVHGLVPLLREARVSVRRPRLAAWILLAAGWCFFSSARFLLPPGMLPFSWRTIGPKAIAAIPSQASVWSDEFFLPHLGMRRYVKGLQKNDSLWFERGLFVPDRVLLSAYWLRMANPDHRDRVLGVLRLRGFVTLFHEKDLFVLANPKTLGKEGGEPEWLNP